MGYLVLGSWSCCARAAKSPGRSSKGSRSRCRFRSQTSASRRRASNPKNRGARRNGPSRRALPPRARTARKAGFLLCHSGVSLRIFTVTSGITQWVFIISITPCDSASSDTPFPPPGRVCDAQGRGNLDPHGRAQVREDDALPVGGESPNERGQESRDRGTGEPGRQKMGGKAAILFSHRPACGRERDPPALHPPVDQFPNAGCMATEYSNAP